MLRYTIFVVGLLGACIANADEPAPTASSTPATASMEAAPAPSLITRGVLLAPKAFRQVAASIRPSLVMIESFGGLNAGEGVSNLAADGPTTGLIISSDGYIITSTFNFLRKPPIITITLADGRRKVATLLGRDETRKLCLLKINDVSDLPVPTFAPREEVRVGQWAVAVGFGFGDKEPSLTAGIISAESRISGRALQTDANLSPANYGGPLLDIDGRLLGICVPLAPGAKDVAAGAEWYDSGIGFAVPLGEIAPIIEAMKAGKTLVPGYLGIQPAPSGNPPSGAEVGSVKEKSPAEAAGLKAGDKLLKIGDIEVLDVAHLSTVVGRYVAGDKITILVRRGEQELTIEAVLGEVPPPPPPMPMPQPGEAAKPAEGKPAEEKPAEEKPAGEKPAEAPAGEAAPAEKKPAEAPPTEEAPTENSDSPK